MSAPVSRPAASAEAELAADTAHDPDAVPIDSAPIDLATIDLDIGGMTCASCATRVQKKLNRMPGVEASVNLATAKARVRYPAEVTPDDLIATVRATGYTAEIPKVEPDEPAAGYAGGAAESAGNDPATALRHRLLICLSLAVPVIVLSMVPPLQFANWQWLALTLASPVAVWGAWPFHRSTVTNLRHGAVTMDTLISVGVLAAFVWSLYALFFGGAGEPGMHMSFAVTSAGDTAELYLEVAAGVTLFILAGRYLEARAKRRSGAALHALLELGAKDVAVLRDGRELRIPVRQLAVGEHFVVRPGEKIATDGVVVEGDGAMDASMLTGESVPVDVHSGDQVAGATVNAGGLLQVRATRIGADTQLAQMARLVEEAQTGKAPVQRLADRVSAVFVPIVIGIAVLTLLGWLMAGAPATAAFTAGVAVLIIACPCALGLATPTALLVGTGRGAALGILIKGPQVLESTRRVDTVVLDKTGTITSGRMRLVGVHAADGQDPAVALRLAGAVEHASEHPIARAIADAATASAAESVDAAGLPRVCDFANEAGLGVQATVSDSGADHAVVVGRPALLQRHGQPLSPELVRAQAEAEASGATVVAVGWDGRARAVLVVADTVKPTSATAIGRLRQLGLRPVLLTGDNERAAAAVAAEVGIDAADVIAAVLPAGKVDAIRRLQADGRVVAMVGDGVNDAAALAQADLGLSMGTGTDTAIEASDLTLVRGDLTVAADAIELSRRTLATIKGNLFWAFAYNVVAIPVAIAGLLNPMLAGAAMAFSSLFVVSNSLRLRRFSPTGQR